MRNPRKEEIFVLLASGFEEAEAATLIRTLRRFGFPVKVVGLTAGPVRGAYGLSLAPDAVLSEVETEQPCAVVLPGGVQGVRKLNADPRVHTLLQRVIAHGGHILALEAAYTILRTIEGLYSAQESTTTKATPRWQESTSTSGRVVTNGAMTFAEDSGIAQEAAMALVAQLEHRG